MARLIVIGNGFDLAHGLPTSYADFREHLKIRNIELHDYLIKLSDESIWSDLEEGLARIEIGDFASALIDDLFTECDRSSHFNDKGTQATAEYLSFTIQQVIKLLTKELQNELHEWVCGIETKAASPVYAFLSPEDYVVSFNYTSTITDLYDISEYQVLHLHNKAKNRSEGYNFHWAINHCLNDIDEYFQDGPNLIFGHGAHAREYRAPAIPLPMMTYDYDCNNASVIAYDAIENAGDFYEQSRKKVEVVMPMLKSFLGEVGKIDSVVILGHSLAWVDIEYFKTISSFADPEAKFTICHHGNDSLEFIKGQASQFVGPGNTVKFVDSSHHSTIERELAIST